MNKKKPGRPKNPKVKISELMNYLDSLPENSQIKKNLTPDKLIVIRRYIEELQYLDKKIKRLKADIDEFGEVEIFIQGMQRLRRANPSMELYYAALRAYRGLVNKIDDIIKGVEIDW